jgi:hypothetical protein
MNWRKLGVEAEIKDLRLNVYPCCGRYCWEVRQYSKSPGGIFVYWKTKVRGEAETEEAAKRAAEAAAEEL